MADRIRIQIEEMEALRGQMLSLSSALQDIRSDIGRVDLDRISGSEVRVHLSSSAFRSVGCSMSGGKTGDCLESIARVLDDMGRYTHAVAGSIGMAADAFADTEQKLVWRFGAMMQGEGSMFQEICGILGLDTDKSKWTSENHKAFDKLIESGQLVVDGGMALLIHEGKQYLLDENGLLASYEKKTGLSGVKETSRIFDGDGMKERTFKFGFENMGMKAKHDAIEKKKIKEGHRYFDKDGKPIDAKDVKKDDSKKLGQKVGVLSIGATKSASVSAFHTEGKIENDKGKAEGSVGVLNAEAHSEVESGFGFYVNKEGKEVLYAGVDAQMGVSVSAVEIEGSAEYELIDGFEVGLEGDISMLSAEAAIGAGLGVVGGKFVAYAEAGAEANLVEVNGEASVDIAGVKGTVGGGVQVGVGASAKAGYKDGVISFDASLSIGVGVSVNFELDVSGFVDNVGNAVQSFADGLSSICGWWR